MTNQETLKLALEALKVCEVDGYIPVRNTRDAIKALEEALAKQEQGSTTCDKPVAHCEAGPDYCLKCLEEAKPTYGSEEIRKLREVIASQAKIIEDMALAKQEQGKPVAWKLMPKNATNAMLKAMDECSTEGYDERLYAGHASSVYTVAWDALDTTPQQRTWVGLTNDECVEIAARGYPRWLEFAQAIEAKLKEKNGIAPQGSDK